MNSIKVIKEEGMRVPLKIWNAFVKIEEASIDQMKDVCAMPFVYNHVALMPDAHWGNGTSVGGVVATKNAIMPAVVGVDIGCGMLAAKTNLKLTDIPKSMWHEIRTEIEKNVPHGRTDNGGKNDRGAWGSIPLHVQEIWDKNLKEGYEKIILNQPKLDRGNHVNHLGTLGTGNHFIEICIDEHDNIWIMLHSGSRGVGNRIGTYFTELAKKLCEQWFINLPNSALAYFPSEISEYKEYLYATFWAQEFARFNRDIMRDAVVNSLEKVLGRDVEFTFTVNCHHNYIARENHEGENVLVTRKGAIRARKDDFGIIPGSMGARSYIVLGKENSDSFHSCSHGAGRAMSRTEAKKRFTVDDHNKATADVECRKDIDVIDETPMAYKNIDDVMRSQEDLITITNTLKQIICVKG